MAIIGACTLTLWKFCAYGAHAFHGERDPIVNRRWLIDIANVFNTSFCPEEANVRYASCLLKDQARDWWEKIGSDLGDDVIDAMPWDDFLNRFRVEFAPTIEV